MKYSAFSVLFFISMCKTEDPIVDKKLSVNNTSEICDKFLCKLRKSFVYGILGLIAVCVFVAILLCTYALFYHKDESGLRETQPVNNEGTVDMVPCNMFWDFHVL